MLRAHKLAPLFCFSCASAPYLLLILILILYLVCLVCLVLFTLLVFRHFFFFFLFHFMSILFYFYSYLYIRTLELWRCSVDLRCICPADHVCITVSGWQPRISLEARSVNVNTINTRTHPHMAVFFPFLFPVESTDHERDWPQY